MSADITRKDIGRSVSRCLIEMELDGFEAIETNHSTEGVVHVTLAKRGGGGTDYLELRIHIPPLDEAMPWGQP